MFIKVSKEVHVKFYDTVQGLMHKIAEINDQFGQ